MCRCSILVRPLSKGCQRTSKRTEPDHRASALQAAGRALMPPLATEGQAKASSVAMEVGASNVADALSSSQLQPQLEPESAPDVASLDHVHPSVQRKLKLTPLDPDMPKTQLPTPRGDSIGAFLDRRPPTAAAAAHGKAQLSSASDHSQQGWRPRATDGAQPGSRPQSASLVLSERSSDEKCRSPLKRRPLSTKC